ncbi:DUF2780 domain-containing protein [Nitrosomonas oligotropha]|uniref:DUF2780 domain-containing protein n=1 Tax=Nitrosomonas oligotropha TaxID=42354 RepID=UPI001367B07C|nr:DUF2780 domain-containing protein [Nitrosomonas oligotropha]MXS84146.1 DUF2780 domain-containing protein [Nitrosomonas oligotropha]
MKRIKLLTGYSLLGAAVFLVTNSYAADLNDLTGAAGILQQGTQAGQAATAVVPSSSTGLTGLLMQQLGVTQPQAEGGSGALFQLAKSKMSTGDFTALGNSVPNMQGLLAAAPVANAVGSGSMTGNLTSMAGNLGGADGNLVGLASSFQQLGLAPDMVQKFIPIVMQYVQGNGGGAVAGALQSALMGGL